ncbi:hypothetical protein ScPMuIL_011191 [Solemya velum]
MATTANPFSLTAAGDLGKHRESMLANELLLRNQLGEPRRRGVTLPDGFTYGQPNAGRDGGANEALHGWPTLSTTSLPFPRKDKKVDRDFMGLNKAAIGSGLVTASENYEFRATHDVRRKMSGDDKQRIRTRRIPPTMVFGISTRPSTPIFDLLEHKYQDKWLQSRRQQELTNRQENTKVCKKTPGKVYDTRATLLRTYQYPVDPAPLWQMPRFARNAKPALQTFRSARARRSAYSHFESDQISRQGALGHGVYEAAVN